MNARKALCLALLEGEVLTVMNCFKITGLTNVAREIPRIVEQPFGVEVSRTPRTGKNRYGDPVSYTEYRLNKTKRNAEGMKKMADYITGYAPATKSQTVVEMMQENKLLNL